MANKKRFQKSALICIGMSVAFITSCTKSPDSKLNVDSIRLVDVQTEDSAAGVKKILSYEACLSSGTKALASQSIDISDGFESRTAATNAKGCAIWNEQHFVGSDFSSSSATVTANRTFSVNDGSPQPTASNSASIDMTFNPNGESRDVITARVEGGSSTAAPLSFESEAQLAQANRSNKQGKAFVPWIALNFQGHAKQKTTVNRLLTLKPAQKFLLRMDPRVMIIRDNNDIALEPVRFGEWKLTILTFNEENFEAKNFNADNLIAEYKGTVKTRHDGNVVEDAYIRIHDVAAVLSRSIAIVILEPVGETAKTTNLGIFYAPMSPLRANNTHLELREMEDAPRDLLTQLEVARQRAHKSLDGVSMLIAAGYKPLELPDAMITKLINKKILTKKEYDRYAQICYQITPAKLTIEPVEIIPRWMGRKLSARNECFKRAHGIVRPEVRDFVVNVKGIGYLEGSNTVRYLNLTRDVNHLMISRIELNQNVNVGVYGDFGIHRGVNVGPAHLSGGAKISTGTNLNMFRARNKEKILNLQIHEGQHFQVYIDSYALDLELKRCVILEPNIEGGRGAFACAKTPHRRKVAEKYFLVNHGRDGSPFTDNDSPDTTDWRLVIRGQKAYDNWERMMTAENVIYDLTKFVLRFTGADLKRPLLPDMRVTQEFPGSLPIKQ